MKDMIYPKEWFSTENMHFRNRLNREAEVFLGGFAIAMLGAAVESSIGVIIGGTVMIGSGLATAFHRRQHENAQHYQNMQHQIERQEYGYESDFKYY